MRRTLMAGALLLAACGGADPITPPASVPSAPEQKASEMSITVTETTVGEFAGFRIGVGNIREKEYTTEDGHTASGPTALVTVIGPDGAELWDGRVHPGQTIDAQQKRLRIDGVQNPPGALGSVTLSEVQK